MTNTNPEARFDPGQCIFTGRAFKALVEHGVSPGAVVEAHATLHPGEMTYRQLIERVQALVHGSQVVSYFRLASSGPWPATADLMVVTKADRSVTIVSLASER